MQVQHISPRGHCPKTHLSISAVQKYVSVRCCPWAPAASPRRRAGDLPSKKAQSTQLKDSRLQFIFAWNYFTSLCTQLQNSSSKPLVKATVLRKTLASFFFLFIDTFFLLSPHAVSAYSLGFEGEKKKTWDTTWVKTQFLFHLFKKGKKKRRKKNKRKTM